ncbi:hypothetical protein DPMN_020114 [Dreissena polymorpha]|uniref:Uncharacterized protein n=1 Tax=Dreissena polymorpha TaxID=45954 RepID=A0A9D4JAS3_DREPO|nr:hypothetical protein DPMN_134530 [Dreissena polymorpha]KAH3895945.1 hypothetical protein DPMN_020114 [Dreissena polymorpha]
MRKELVLCSQRKILTTPTQPLHPNRQPEYQGVKFVLDAVTITAFKPAAVDVLRVSPLHVI